MGINPTLRNILWGKPLRICKDFVGSMQIGSHVINDLVPKLSRSQSDVYHLIGKLVDGVTNIKGCVSKQSRKRGNVTLPSQELINLTIGLYLLLWVLECAQSSFELFLRYTGENQISLIIPAAPKQGFHEWLECYLRKRPRANLCFCCESINGSLGKSGRCNSSRKGIDQPRAQLVHGVFALSIPVGKPSTTPSNGKHCRRIGSSVLLDHPRCLRGELCLGVRYELLNFLDHHGLLLKCSPRGKASAFFNRTYAFTQIDI